LPARERLSLIPLWIKIRATSGGRGLGTGLLRDAVLRTFQAAEIAGIRGILVHAISEAAKRFYQSYGFVPSPIDPMTLIVTVVEAARLLEPRPAKNT
jgi:hypothetical protein